MAEETFNPGKSFKFSKLTSCGFSIDHRGIGDMGLSFQRLDNKYVWVDAFRIAIVDIKPSMWARMTADTTRGGWCATTDAQRSLSVKQGRFLADLVAAAVKEKLGDHFPSDEEIDAMKEKK